MVKKKTQTPFGKHLMIDAYNCDPKALNDKKLVFNLLNDLPGKIDMHKMMEPYVLWAEGNDKKDPGGWSGFVMIQESHISIHSFIKRRFVTMDVYSCNNFNSQIVINYFKDVFKTKDLEIHEEIRGTKYPEENID